MGPWDALGGGSPTFGNYATLLGAPGGSPFGSLSPGMMPGGGGGGMPMNILPQGAQTAPAGVGQIASAGMPPMGQMGPAGNAGANPNLLAMLGLNKPMGQNAQGGSNTMAQLGLNMLRPQSPLQSVAPQMQFYQPRPTGMLGY